MELRKYISIVMKWWWLILLAVILATASSYYASKKMVPQYRAKTTLMVGKIIQNPDPNSGEFYLSQQLANTYQQMILREPVLQGTVDALGWSVNWELIATKITANVVPNTQLIEIYAADENPATAKALADTVAQQVIKLSPSGASQVNTDQLHFIQEQLPDLETKISTAKTELVKLNNQLDTANSAREIQDIQDQINILETKVSTWQSTYADLLKTIEGGDVNALTVVEQATVPVVPFSPNTRMNVLLAAAIGFALSIGGIFLIEYFDDTIQEQDSIQNILNLPILANISRINGKKTDSMLVTLDAPQSSEADSFRILRINLQSIANWQSLQTILFTSAEPSVGKSVTASNLAVVMAQFGQKVILVEADLRKPSVHRLFGVPKEDGLSDLILDTRLTVINSLKSTSIDNLKILTCGARQINSIEALGSERMKIIVRELSTLADVVIFDCPPALMFSDTYMIAKLVNGVIVVSRLGKTPSKLLKRVLDDLRLAGINILGVVVQQRKRQDRYGYRYYKSYAATEKKDSILHMPLRKHKKASDQDFVQVEEQKYSS